MAAEVEVAAAADCGLPADFPARLGLGVLADYAVTFDYKNRRIWFETPALAAAEPAAAATNEVPEPVHYRGVRP